MAEEELNQFIGERLYRHGHSLPDLPLTCAKRH